MNADRTPMNADIQKSRLDRISLGFIGVAQQVSSTLGVGFVEKVYENSLVIELRKRGLEVEQQRPVHVHYDGQIVGDFIPDLMIEQEIVVEIKALPLLEPNHRQQCINYLRSTGCRVCLLLNFGRPRLETKRIVWNF